jgi:transcriptional regulator with XRE-family HTH domain
MRTNDQLFNSIEYWMEIIQNELSLQVKNYMDEKGLSQVQLAKELGVTKSFIVQVLKGKVNYSLSKLIELSIAVGVAPNIEFKSLTDYQSRRENKTPKREMNLSITEFLHVKGGKIKLPLHMNQNGTVVSLDVHQVSTITPTDKKVV